MVEEELMVRTDLALARSFEHGNSETQALLAIIKAHGVGVRVWVVEGNVKVKMPLQFQMPRPLI